MSDLSFSRLCAMVDAPVHHQTAADSAAKGHIEDRVAVNACTMQRLPQGGNIRVIINVHRKPG
jgi:hypothetical protein